jgi:hypothetical protein
LIRTSGCFTAHTPAGTMRPCMSNCSFRKRCKIKNLRGSVLHRTVRDMVVYSRKVVEYALLNAGKYHAAGKRATFVKRFIAPPFTFVKFYVFKLGFLDGWEGLVCARMTAYYTFLKYARLHELRNFEKRKPDAASYLMVKTHDEFYSNIPPGGGGVSGRSPEPAHLRGQV